MPLSLNNNRPSTVPFQSPIQVSSTSIEQNVSKKIWMSLSLKKIVSSNSKHMAYEFPDETSQIVQISKFVCRAAIFVQTVSKFHT